MTTLLQLKTSIFAEGGQSSRLTDEFVRNWRAANPRGRVIVRDLAALPVPHLTAERFLAFSSKEEDRTPEQQAVLDYSDALIDELKQADEIVLAAPLYNFGLPSGLKAYFDHVARAGVTFRYTANGPVGLLLNKKVTVVATSGGFHAGTPRDASSQYLRNFLGFLGLTDIQFVYAEGLAISPEQKERSLHDAQAAIRNLFAVDVLAEVA